MKNFRNAIFNLFVLTKLIAKLIKQTGNKFSKLYKIYILKDEFTIQVKKWFADRGDQTLRLEYPELTSDSIVFDLGGYLGDFSAAIVERYNCKIYIFEPHPEYFFKCIERFSSYKNVMVLNYGLADKDGEFLLSNQSDGSSFINPNHAQKDGIKCVIRDFSNVLDELDIINIDLMKINIEGGEFPLMEHIVSCGKQALVRQYQIQFHNFVENAVTRRIKISRALSETHVRTWCYTFVWENWRKI
jgi:FkbM family methyltransferase